MKTHSLQRPATTPAALIAKSVVGVALVAGLAWIGVASLGTREAGESSVDAAAAAAGVVNRGDHAAVHRREVFEARRARFEGQGEAQVAKATHLEYPAP